MPHLPRRNRGQEAAADLAALFDAHGWRVKRDVPGQALQADLLAQRGARRLAVEIKTATEGRADRVIPLLAQAVLQAQTYATATSGVQPLAVVYLDEASEALIKQVSQFVDRYVPGTAVGVVARNGMRYFRDPGQDLNAFNAAPATRPRRSAVPAVAPVNLFSDLNQWMLKVLLAPELPLDLLTAPRDHFRTGTEFAQAAGVSTMSATRLLQQLRQEGYLDDSAATLKLVRREELLRRWQAAAMKSPHQKPMRFLLKTPIEKQLQTLLRADPARICQGLFSAAHALGLGHVSGVPPYLLVPKLKQLDDKTWRGLVVMPSGTPELIVREAAAPQSTFRGAVLRDGAASADVIQTWLDVGSHPARGEEQAALIYQQVIGPYLLDRPR